MSKLLNIFYSRLQYSLKKMKNTNQNKQKHSIISELLPTSEVKVHLGCGSVNISGFINIDALDYPHIHIVKQNLWLNEFQDSSLTEIYANHVLERVDRKILHSHLNHYYTKLKNNGILKISVSDFSKIIRIYLSNGVDCECIQSLLFGDKTNDIDYNVISFDFSYLSKLLTQAGFSEISLFSSSSECLSNKSYPFKSLKVNGVDTDISLNVIAKK